MAEEQANNDATSDEGSKKKPGLMTLIKAGVFLSVIVGIQLAAASMLLPSESETKDIAEKLAVAAAAEDPEHLEETGEEDSTPSAR